MINQVPDQNARPFDLDKSQKLISAAVMGMLTLGLAKEDTLDPDVVAQTWASIREAIIAGVYACGEIRRMREEITQLRDGHRPQPHADPTQPGALCATCSLDGALVSWPCQVWTASDHILTQGQP